MRLTEEEVGERTDKLLGLSPEALSDRRKSIGASDANIILGGDATVHQGLPDDIEFTETAFSYRVTLPFWSLGTIERTTTFWGIHFTELQSDPDATYSAWYRFGGDEAPQIPFGGRIGSTTINFTWWY